MLTRGTAAFVVMAASAVAVAILGRPPHDAAAGTSAPTASGLDYSTFLGGAGSEAGFGLAVDHAGNVFVSGSTTSADFPTTPGALDRSYNGDFDAFVARLDAAGSALVYATYLGGTDSDESRSLAIDGAGNAYVGGRTLSVDFPTTPGAFDRTQNGSAYEDAFVTKLSPSGDSLEYSTYLGGRYNEVAFGVALGQAGTAYATGLSSSPDFPTTPGAFDRNCAGDAFVTKLNAAGSDLAYSTCIGGGTGDYGLAVAVEQGGAASLTGMTRGAAFPTTPDAYDPSFNGGVFDAFVTTLNTSGTALVYSTFLGGSDEDWGGGIAVDAAGSTYVTGRTASGPKALPHAVFPTTPGAFDTTLDGHADAFVTKLP
jgi:hypothetical protein